MGLMDWRALIPWKPAYDRHSAALPAPAIAAMREAVLASPYMGANNLNTRFAGTYGFSMVFTREGLAEVASRFPDVVPFLDRALLRDCNAFFLNPLVVAQGAAVAPHRDASLRSYHPETRFPRRVSVLYLQVPAGLQGGELRLYEGDRLLAVLAPEQGALVSFRGDLRHEVASVTAGAPDAYDARISLVVEQYRLSKRQLAAVPAFHLGTRRPAGAEAALAGGPGEGEFGAAIRAALEAPDAPLDGDSRFH